VKKKKFKVFGWALNATRRLKIRLKFRTKIMLFKELCLQERHSTRIVKRQNVEEYTIFKWCCVGHKHSLFSWIDNKHQTIERISQILPESWLYSVNRKESWSRYSYQIFNRMYPNDGLLFCFHGFFSIFQHKSIGFD
jgi:hypothetical protein